MNWGFTCTYVPISENDANDANPISPVSVVLNDLPHNRAAGPMVLNHTIGSWDKLVEKGVTLGDTGAPAALDPDDHPHPNTVQGQGAIQGEEGEKEKTWSGLVEVGAVLGDGGNTASEVDIKVQLWGLTLSI
jgi:hypothetical protein